MYFFPYSHIYRKENVSAHKLVIYRKGNVSLTNLLPLSLYPNVLFGGILL